MPTDLRSIHFAQAPLMPTGGWVRAWSARIESSLLTEDDNDILTIPGDAAGSSRILTKT